MFFRRTASSAARAGRYEMLSRDHCHLCDQMAVVLDEVLPAMKIGWTRVAIDDHPRLVERFNDVVPVLLRDGEPVAKIRLDRRQLERIVRRRR